MNRRLVNDDDRTTMSGGDTRSSQIIREGIHSGSQTSRIRSGGPVTPVRARRNRGRPTQFHAPQLLPVCHTTVQTTYMHSVRCPDPPRNRNTASLTPASHLTPHLHSVQTKPQIHKWQIKQCNAFEWARLSARCRRLCMAGLLQRSRRDRAEISPRVDLATRMCVRTLLHPHPLTPSRRHAVTPSRRHDATAPQVRNTLMPSSWH